MSRNWLNVEHTPVVHCSECGAQTWMPLKDLPRGWRVIDGVLYCNLHGEQE
jgi:hypothetical protein